MLCSIGDSPGDGVARPSVNRRNSHGLVVEEVQTVNPDLVRTRSRREAFHRALTAGLQKVSDQLELSKPVPQIVVSKQ